MHFQLLVCICASAALGALTVSALETERESLIMSQAQLLARMYTTEAPADACVRLLNATAEIGCAAPGGRPIDGVLVHADQLAASEVDAAVVLLPARDASELMLRLQSDELLRKRVQAVLVQAGNASALSTADTFPSAAYAPYSDHSYPWNPAGSGLSQQRIGVPVMLVSNDTAADAVRRSASNSDKAFTGSLHCAKLRLDMQARHNSSTCLAEGLCLPLGGNSVWAALPPLHKSSGASGHMPVTLFVASADSGGLFHDSIVGAEAPLSGLIAMLTAADILSRISPAARQDYQRHLVFTVFAGETWDYMGSKRFLWELHQGSNSTAGLSLDLIDQVVEVGQVGKAAGSGGAASFYLHSQRERSFGDAGLLRKMLQSAASASDQVRVHSASEDTPGIPPSSLMSLLRAKPAIAGVVLADFDKRFTNPYYESQLDIDSNIDLAAVAAAAEVAARTLHALALDDEAAAKSLEVNRTAVAEMVRQLSDCLTATDPGLTCPLAADLMSAFGPAEHYIGVLRSPSRDSQDPDPLVKGNLARFLWNFLANRTAAAAHHEAEPAQCDYGKHKCTVIGEQCVGWKAAEKWPASAGRCLATSAHYVPAYSPRLRCKDCDGSATQWQPQWEVTDEARDWEQRLGWPPDPMWTESNWPDGQPYLQLYQAEEPGWDAKVLMAGIALTAATYVLAVVVQRWLQQFSHLSEPYVP